MKKLILASTLAIISASSFAADDHSGFRVGAGLGTDIGKYQLKNLGDSGKLSADPSVTIEAGYDFNEIFAVNVKGSSMGFTDYGKSRKGKSEGTAYELAVEAEAGYTFDIDGRVAIKPYVAVGAVGFDKDTSNVFFEEDKSAVRGRGALGARMTLDSGVYIDGRIQATDYTTKGEKFSGKGDEMLTQGMISVGYKF
ncbi:porin family protein [Vibrio mexicanus]|uniref:porin family protein n=1 Tax=Vibrio mexicanus TaxID=1004326 RepID=UPI00063CC0F9|nr:porin family protein [Vibrio mexicanus]